MAADRSQTEASRDTKQVGPRCVEDQRKALVELQCRGSLYGEEASEERVKDLRLGFHVQVLAHTIEDREGADAIDLHVLQATETVSSKSISHRRY